MKYAFKFLWAFLWQCTIAAGFYAAFVLNVHQGLRNLVYVLVWGVIFPSLLVYAIFSDGKEPAYREQVLPGFLFTAFAVADAAFLAWGGAIGTGIAWLFCTLVLREMMRKPMKGASNGTDS